MPRRTSASRNWDELSRHLESKLSAPTHPRPRAALSAPTVLCRTASSRPCGSIGRLWISADSFSERGKYKAREHRFMLVVGQHLKASFLRDRNPTNVRRQLAHEFKLPSPRESESNCESLLHLSPIGAFCRFGWPSLVFIRKWGFDHDTHQALVLPAHQRLVEIGQ